MGKDSSHRGEAKQRTRFARLDHDLLRSAAYRALAPADRALLVELAMIYNLSNNGSLFLSVRDAAARIGVADLTTASQAFANLMALGFIDIVEEGTFSSSPDKPSRARCWRLTWVAAPGQPATFDYRNAVIRGGKASRRAREGRLALERHTAGNSRGPKTNTLTSSGVLESNTLTEITGSAGGASVAESNTGLPQKALITVEPDRIGKRYTSRDTTTGVDAAASETTANTPQIAAGAFSGTFARRLLAALRDDVIEHLAAAGYGAAKALSEASGVPAPVLSRFRNGGSLPDHHFAALKLALSKNSEKREAA